MGFNFPNPTPTQPESISVLLLSCTHFHLLYISFLCLSSVMGSSLMQAGFLQPCLDFLLYRMALYKVFGWILLLTRTVSLGIFPNRYLKRLKFALLKFMLMALLCSLLLESWNPWSHCLFSQDCPQLSQIHNQFFLVCKNQVQLNTLLCWYQEVIISML